MSVSGPLLEQLQAMLAQLEAGEGGVDGEARSRLAALGAQLDALQRAQEHVHAASTSHEHPSDIAIAQQIDSLDDRLGRLEDKLHQLDSLDPAVRDLVQTSAAAILGHPLQPAAAPGQQGQTGEGAGEGGSAGGLGEGDGGGSGGERQVQQQQNGAGPGAAT